MHKFDVEWHSNQGGTVSIMNEEIEADSEEKAYDYPWNTDYYCMGQIKVRYIGYIGDVE